MIDRAEVSKNCRTFSLRKQEGARYRSPLPQDQTRLNYTPVYCCSNATAIAIANANATHLSECGIALSRCLPAQHIIYKR